MIYEIEPLTRNIAKLAVENIFACKASLQALLQLQHLLLLEIQFRDDRVYALQAFLYLLCARVNIWQVSKALLQLLSSELLAKFF